MLQDKRKAYTVYYHDRKVGILAETETGFSCFSYDEDWLKNGFSISPFYLPLKSGLFAQSPDRAYFGGLFGVFYDCLPDEWGNRLVDRYLVKQGISPMTFSLFQRLCLLDSASLGALSFEPNEANRFDKKYDLDQLAKKYEIICQDDNLDDPSFLEAYHAGSSTGGSQPKANCWIDGNLWLIKFPNPRKDLPNLGQIEFEYNLAARECGIPLPEFKYFSGKNGGYFGSKRFDRDLEGKPIHMISLASLLEANIAYPTVDYLTFLQVCYHLCPKDLKTAYKMMCFNIFSRNKDDHARNFSFLYNEKEHRYRLAPFYDITYTPFIAEHALGVNWIGNPNKEDLFEVGKKVYLSIEWQKQTQDEIEAIVNARLSKFWK